MKSLLYIFIVMFIIIETTFAEVSVKIISSRGEAKVRFGLEENWNRATAGIQLKEIDSILTGENGEIVIQFSNGKKFVLGSNSILDIGDLREIKEKELFLFLMSKKVENFEPRQEKTKLRIGNISSTYGEDKIKRDSTVSPRRNSSKELNGAIALFIQEYYTNTLYKLHTLIDKYQSIIDMGEVYYYIAKAFEALNKKGQAIDSYQQVIDYYTEKDSLNRDEKSYLNETKIALKILKQD